MYQVIVDGQIWIDSDGTEEFTYFELGALVESLESMGYLDIEAVKLG